MTKRWTMIIKTKLMTTGITTSLRSDNEGTDVVDSFCLLGSTANSKGTSSQKYAENWSLVKKKNEILGKNTFYFVFILIYIVVFNGFYVPSLIIYITQSLCVMRGYINLINK